jgi:glutathione S-transferase
MMKIYWIKAQAPQRVLALIKHLKLKAELIEVNTQPGGLKSESYAKLNPNLKAPTLVDGDFVLWESSAIMAYLCIKAGSDMWPAHNPVEQVEVLRWLSWNDCHWSPATGAFYFEHIVKATFDLGTPDSALLKDNVPELLRWAKVLDGHLVGKTYVARLQISNLLPWRPIGENRKCHLKAFPISCIGSIHCSVFQPGPIHGLPKPNNQL